MENQGKPLQGLRVLELGQVLAGPFAGAIFADLGADVTKVERIEGGDDARRMGPPFRYGDALNFHIFNRGKQSVALDLKSPQGLALFEQLAAQADILVHNLRPGVVDAMGIDGESLCARHPRLVYCEISAFGHLGPLSKLPGYEPLIQAYSGLSSTNGGPEDPPIRIGASVCDQGAGMWAVIGTLALLQRRQITGRGGIVNTSLLETALCWNGQKNDSYANLGEVPQRHASGHPGFVPYQAFDTASGPLLICCGNDRLFAKLAREVGRPEWITDPRFATNLARLQNQQTLLPLLAALLREADRDAWIIRLEAAGVPCSPVNSVPEALAQEQVKSLGMLQAVPGEDFCLTGLPLSIDGVRPVLQGRAPALGEHNPVPGGKPPTDN
jgi:crotonobetainyl-CoA:carnitine CoA-transferase CaiB-like acyl-CoA transferase